MISAIFGTADARLVEARMIRVTVLAAALTAMLVSGCGGSPAAPIPECALDHTGDLDLVNLSDNLAPRDVYVDGHIVTTVPSGGHIIVSAAAGVVHTIEWVSTITGASLDVTRVLVDECTTSTLTNHF
jgi:hypothetical protein